MQMGDLTMIGPGSTGSAVARQRDMSATDFPK